MNGKRWTQEDTDTLIRMNAVGYTDAEVGRVTGHAPDTVLRRRQALGLPPCHRVDWTKRQWRERIPSVAREGNYGKDCRIHRVVGRAQRLRTGKEERSQSHV